MIAAYLLIEFIWKLHYRLFHTKVGKTFFLVINFYEKGVLIDFMSFAPSFGMIFLGERGQQISQEFVLLRMFRMARLVMVVMNNWPECELALDALYFSAMKSLPTLSALLLLMGVALALGSSLLYAAELPGYNGRKSPLDSIPMAAWSVLEMVSTVGLGDVAPITPLGRLFGAFLMTGAMAVVAFPSIIIASNFQKVYDRLQRERETAEQHTVATLVENQMERV